MTERQTLEQELWVTKQAADTAGEAKNFFLANMGGSDACSPVQPCFADQEQVAGSLASSSYMGVQHAVERGKKVIAPFDEAGLLAQAPYALPAAHGVVKLVGEAQQPQAVLEAARQLKTDGYALALDLTSAMMPVRIARIPSEQKPPTAFSRQADGLSRPERPAFRAPRVDARPLPA